MIDERMNYNVSVLFPIHSPLEKLRLHKTRLTDESLNSGSISQCSSWIVFSPGFPLRETPGHAVGAVEQGANGGALQRFELQTKTMQEQIWTLCFDCQALKLRYLLRPTWAYSRTFSLIHEILDCKAAKKAAFRFSKTILESLFSFYHALDEYRELDG